jgi:hypothetical protein
MLYQNPQNHKKQKKKIFKLKKDQPKNNAHQKIRKIECELTREVQNMRSRSFT